MSNRLSLILVALAGGIVFSTSAFAEAAPSCPGGGTATGTFHCTGVLNPVCSEGPPWVCSINGNTTNLSGLVMDNSNGGGGHPHHGNGFGAQQTGRAAFKFR